MIINMLFFLLLFFTMIINSVNTYQMFRLTEGHFMFAFTIRNYLDRFKKHNILEYCIFPNKCTRRRHL